VMEQGVCRHVRLAAGGAGARPGLVRSVEKTLTGQRLNPALIAAAAAAVEEAFSPTHDFRATAEYQRAMAGVLARRALTQAAL